MYVVGLTGGVGSGKSTVAAHFAKLGIQIINADVLAREVVAVGSHALGEIAEHFGSNILTNDGELNRAKLRQLVFDNEEERLWLERLLHPLIAKLIQKGIAECQSEYCILESPLLLETSQHSLVDRILVIDVSETTQLQRTLQRDNSDEKTIRAIMAAQMLREERLQRADDVIANDNSLNLLEPQVERLHNIYIELAREGRR